ncbi:CPBP family intramembrane glutamic endopeptidase [Microbacterium paludicola]|uniref:CPBP family intramembrane glutamic endopeptidase n=1 Tax=Microbacterium paludicola TaxID=300019 RepID=UPI00119EDF19|nr:CPBP family intramembrane glutamic endopeptidase [Microbacterium paludicola]
MSSSATATSTRASRHRGRRRPWWRGGSSVRRWNIDLLGWALLALGAGLLGGALLGGMLGTAVLWVALLVPVVLAYRRGVPRGLLIFRPVDLLYGIVLGSILRFAQGLFSEAFGGSGALPTYPSLNGGLPAGWWVQDLLGGAIVAPVIEEFFFRGLLLIVIFTLVRRLAGSHPAAIGLGGFVGVVASTALFVLAHALTEALPAAGVVSLTLVGLVCGTLVVTTGRIWPAVLVHVVYNGSGVLLTVAGTMLA